MYGLYAYIVSYTKPLCAAINRIYSSYYLPALQVNPQRNAISGCLGSAALLGALYTVQYGVEVDGEGRGWGSRSKGGKRRQIG